MQEVAVENLITDGLQIRPKIDEAHVAELVEVLKAGKNFRDNIVVYKDPDGKLWVADGHHRISAYMAAGRRLARCDIHKGTFGDALRYALGANSEHGKRRDEETVKAAILRAYADRDKIGLGDVPSARCIADIVHCSPDYANRHLSTVDTWRKSPVRTGADGKTYRIPPPPPRNIPPPPSVTPTEPRRIPPPPSSTPPSAPAKPTGPVDAVGYPIPDHLQGLFKRGAEVQALLGQISSIKGTLKRAEETGDVLYEDCRMQQALAALETAYDTIKATKPYVVCPWCKGVMSDQCRGCGKRGVLGEFRYDTTVPRELKS